MGFEEHFETRDRHHGNYREERFPVNHRHIDYSHHSSHGEGNYYNWMNILQKIRSNKKLKFFVLLAGLLLLTIVIVLIVVLLPFILKLLNYITTNGLQGIIDGITGFLDKILKGTAK
jgi:hypothetical protein